MPHPLRLFALLFAASLLASGPARADDLDRLMAEASLKSQIEQVGQTVRSKTSELVVSAMGFLGVPYRRGGDDAEGGFDCSGFVKAMYAQSVGLLLPRRAEQQAAATQRIDKTELQPGDLVFFNTLRRTFSHVGIYVGEGRFIHSPKPGAQVRVENMGVNYWASRFDGARRVSAASALSPPLVPAFLAHSAGRPVPQAVGSLPPVLINAPPSAGQSHSPDLYSR
ncbi:MAG: C40 family peptidase [Polaromonas sp.]|nr:C40 family peptidase [Polaromonas sp.]